MWEPRRLTTLWVSTACYRDSLIFFPPSMWSGPAFVWGDWGKPQTRSEKLTSGQGLELRASRIKRIIAIQYKATPDTNRFATESFQERESSHLRLPGCNRLLLLSRRYMLALSSTSKMTTTCTSETTLNIYQTTRHHTSEYSNLRNHHCENYKSRIRRIL
jgi:hypothetical protein